MTDEEVHDGDIPEDVAERLDQHDTFMRTKVYPTDEPERYAMGVTFGHKDESIQQAFALTHEQVAILHHEFEKYLEAVGDEDYEVTEHIVRDDDRDSDRGIQ